MIHRPNHLLRPLVCLLLSCLAFPLFAKESVVLDLPAQSAATALETVSKKFGVDVIFGYDELAKVKSNAVSGDLKPAAALELLLRDTGYTATQTGPKNFVVAQKKIGTGTIQGELVRSDTGEPAANATIGIPDTTFLTRTDRLGRYALSNVPPGKYDLVAGGDGYGRLRITDLTVRPNHVIVLGTEHIPAVSGDVQKLSEFVVSAHADDVEQMGEFIVNGQKPAPFSDANVDLPRGIDDVQPYYIFNAQTIQQSGAVDVEDFLKTRLTMDTTALSNGQKYDNPLGNTSTVSLRGLGASQTLILIDGRRTASVSYAGTTEQPDINGVPLAAIDRIEVLPSSASAIYGGSAVGGVINIVLKKDYQGGEIKATYDTPSNTDAPLRSLDLTYGFAADGGKTHVLLSAHYSDGKVMLLQDRIQLVNRGYSTILKNDPGFFILDTSFPVLGATPNIGSFDSGTGTDGYQNLTLKNGGTALNSVIATIATGASAANASTIIPGEWNYTLAPTEEQNGLLSAIGSAPKDKSFMASVRQEIFPKLEAFVDISTESNSSVSLYDPISTAAGYYVQSNAAANPFNQDVFVSFATTETVPLVTDSVTRSVSVGLVAQLPFNWKSEIDYTWSQNAFEAAYDSYDDTAFSAAIANGTVNPFVDTLAHPLNLVPFLAREITESCGWRVGRASWGC